jgi:hypothetical protein
MEQRAATLSVVDQGRLPTSVTAELKLSVAELDVFFAAGEEVDVNLRSPSDALYLHQVMSLAAAKHLRTHGPLVLPDVDDTSRCELLANARPDGS